MEQFNTALAQIDLALKEARFNQARTLFFEIAQQKCPRDKLLELCQMARRLNQPYYIIRWLYPIVRAEAEISQPASDAEKSIFAVGLTRVGAFQEAKDILLSLPKQQADKYFALGLLNIWQWNYEQAIRPLKKYLQFFPVGHYSYLIGLLNLTASYIITDQLEQGNESAKTLLSYCEQNQYPLLKANTLEILAQSCVHQKNYDQAETYLNESATILKSSGSDYELFVNKWKLVLQMLRSEVNAEEVSQLKTLAQSKRVFEAVRELDLYQAFSKHNEKDFLKVYSGTRFSGYKKRIKSFFGYSRPIPREHQCRFGEDKTTSVFRVQQLALTKTSESLLQIILSDYYRPIQLGEVFKELYPDEHFNPQSSMPRLYQVFRRLKLELKEKQAPIKVIWQQKQISWQPQTSFILQIEPKENLIELLSMSTSIFSVEQIIQEMNVSKSSAYRLIDQAIAARKVRRQGAGVFKKTG